MPFNRCSSQKDQTLEEFYSELASSNDHVSSSIGKTMLSVLDLIRHTFPETNIFGLTSHHHLKLLPYDDWAEKWHVSIIAFEPSYHIEYLLPEDQAPWPNAHVTGETTSLQEFRKLLITALYKSKGWENSRELTKLYHEMLT